MFAIAVDVYGGDLGPRVALKACQQILHERADVQLWLPLLEQHRQELDKLFGSHIDRVTSVACDQIVPADASLQYLLRQCLNSSMGLALAAQQQGVVDGVISSGSTSALMVLSKRILGTLPDLQRPALAKELPTRENPVLMLDLGANLAPNADLLVMWSLLAVAWRRSQSKGPSKLALLNVGSEAVKGPAQIREAAASLKDLLPQEFVGYAEGYDLFHGDIDIVVCDGFAGNVALKTIEGMSEWFAEKRTEGLQILKKVKKLQSLIPGLTTTDYPDLSSSVHSGALLLGLNGLVVKSHGNSDQSCFYHALQYICQQAEGLDFDALKSKYGELLAQSGGTLDSYPD